MRGLQEWHYETSQAYFHLPQYQSQAIFKLYASKQTQDKLSYDKMADMIAAAATRDYNVHIHIMFSPHLILRMNQGSIKKPEFQGNSWYQLTLSFDIKP